MPHPRPRTHWLTGLLAASMATGLGTLATPLAHAQGGKDQPKGTTMREARWWMGVKVGVNYAQPRSTAAFSVLSYSDQPADGTTGRGKQYDGQYAHRGFQVGWLTGYAFNRIISLWTQPTFSSATFGYRTNYAWLDPANNANRLEIQQSHVQTINAVELPLVLKLTLPITRKLHLYAQGGGFYAWQLNARKSVATTNVERTAAGELRFDAGTQSTGVTPQVAARWKGWLVGGGLSYDVDYVRLALECNYRTGLDNLTNPANRFGDPRLAAGSYDVPDDFRLRQLEFSLVATVPLDNLIHLKKASTAERPNRRGARPSF